MLYDAYKISSMKFLKKKPNKLRRSTNLARNLNTMSLLDIRLRKYFVPVIKRYDQSNLKKEWLFWFMYSDHSLLLREGWTGTYRQEQK